MTAPAAWMKVEVVGPFAWLKSEGEPTPWLFDAPEARRCGVYLMTVAAQEGWTILPSSGRGAMLRLLDVGRPNRSASVGPWELAAPSGPDFVSDPYNLAAFVKKAMGKGRR
jgi:hypothetical protein